MRIYIMALICIGLSGMLGYAAGTIETQRALIGWTCTDQEPDGCAEWRRVHEHAMPEGSKR